MLQQKNNNLTKIIPLVVASLTIAILSTVCVQITVLHYGPYIRAVQCYFNNIILQHTSVDIYQGSDVIYWRTAQYTSLNDIYQFFQRFSGTLSNINSFSLIQLNQSLAQTVQIQLSGEYNYQNELVAVYFNESFTDVQQLIDRTMFNRSFYQHLDQIKIHVVIPIINEEYDFIDFNIEADFYSGLQMYVQIEANPKLYSQYDEYYPQSKMHQSNNDLQIHKITTFNRLTLNNIWIRWLVVSFNLIITIFLLFSLAVQRKKIKLLQTGLTIAQTIQLMGVARIICLIISFSAVLAHFVGDGYVCLLCWIRMTIFLSDTENPFMLGFLLKRALPAYGKLMLNLAILLTGFVFLSMTMFGFSKKFQSAKLSYYEYLFNFFQYGIYENFLAILPFGFVGQLLFFVHLIIVVSIGNNILQSILASQLLKNSYLNSLKDFIEAIHCKCPQCFAAPEIKKKVKINLPKKSRLVSQFLQEHFSNKKSNYEYQINITSPKLSPYFSPQQTKMKRKRRKSSSSQSIASMIEEKPNKLLFQIEGEEVLPSQYDNLNQRIRTHKKSLFDILEILSKNWQKNQVNPLIMKQILSEALKRIERLETLINQEH